MPNEQRGDCARCAALCCVAYAFDRSEDFGFDKAAGEPCRNLSRQRHLCTIHDQLAGRGFGGCAAYDCAGAGQVVTQEIFGGRSWRDDPALLAPMVDAFLVLRHVQELRQMLAAAHELPLDGAQAARVSAYEQALTGEEGWSAARLAALEPTGLLSEIRAYLRELRGAALRRGAGGPERRPVL